MARRHHMLIPTYGTSGDGGLPEIQLLTLSEFQDYVNGVGMAFRPVITGYGPFGEVSLDNGSVPRSISQLAAALQGVLTSDPLLTGKATVEWASKSNDTADGLIIHARLNNATADVSGESSVYAAYATPVFITSVPDALAALGWTHALSTYDVPNSGYYTGFSYAVDSLSPSGTSLSFWLSVEALIYNRGIVCFDDGSARKLLVLASSSNGGEDFNRFELLDSSGSLGFVNLNTPIAVGAWSHIRMEFDTDSNVIFYQDGVACGSKAYDDTFTTTKIFFGVYDTHSFGVLEGTGAVFADVRYYDRPLSLLEGLTLAQGGDEILLATTITGRGNVPEMTIIQDITLVEFPTQQGIADDPGTPEEPATKPEVLVDGFTDEATTIIDFVGSAVPLEYSVVSGVVGIVTSVPDDWTIIDGGIGASFIRLEYGFAGSLIGNPASVSGGSTGSANITFSNGEDGTPEVPGSPGQPEKHTVTSNRRPTGGTWNIGGSNITHNTTPSPSGWASDQPLSDGVVTLTSDVNEDRADDALAPSDSDLEYPVITTAVETIQDGS